MLTIFEQIMFSHYFYDQKSYSFIKTCTGLYIEYILIFISQQFSSMTNFHINNYLRWFISLEVLMNKNIGCSVVKNIGY